MLIYYGWLRSRYFLNAYVGQQALVEQLHPFVPAIVKADRMWFLNIPVIYLHINAPFG